MYDIRSVTVAEIMGRHAGCWPAPPAGRREDCDGPDLILLPEVPSIRTSSCRVDELQSRKSNVIIAASEGVRTADGTYLCDLVSTAGQLDAFGHKAILSGTSRYLSELIHTHLGCKSRAMNSPLSSGVPAIWPAAPTSPRPMQWAALPHLQPLPERAVG